MSKQGRELFSNNYLHVIQNLRRGNGKTNVKIFDMTFYINCLKSLSLLPNNYENILKKLFELIDTQKLGQIHIWVRQIARIVTASLIISNI